MNSMTTLKMKLKELEEIEKEVATALQSAVQPHEGSSYAAQKVFHMALHRLEHARSRMNELERLRHQQQQDQPQQQPPIQQQMQQPQQEQDS